MKVAVIGLGNVGSALAFKMLDYGIIDELILYDIKMEYARGFYEDLSHAASESERPPKLVLAEKLEDIEDCDVVVITAGVGRKPGMSRRELAEVNARIVTEIGKKLAERNENALYLVVTNPVDAMAMILYKATGLKVIGTGTSLETARLKTYLARKLGVSPREVAGFVAGEHGEDAVILWSTVEVRGKPVEESVKKNEVEAYVKGISVEIIRAQGGTRWGPAAVFADIIKSYLTSEDKLIPVSRPIELEGLGEVFVSIPTLMSDMRIYLFDELREDEKEGIRKAAKSILETYRRACKAAGVC